MSHAPVQNLSRILGSPVTRLALIKENKYCLIYRAALSGNPVIIKCYKGSDPRLAETEARALTFYHQTVSDMPTVISPDTVLFDPDHNVVCMNSIPGEALTALVNRGRHDSSARREALAAMGLLGTVLRRFAACSTAATTTPDPHHYEYITYCSRRLSRIPLLGTLLFRSLPEQAETLWHNYCAAAVPMSLAHGDLVFRNIHVDNQRLGIFDFANASYASHTLNDVYNLKLALLNMLLPAAYKRALWQAFLAGLGMPGGDPRVHAFFAEYHRRRWLMLKLLVLSPRAWCEVCRGLLSFARPGVLQRILDSDSVHPGGGSCP